MTPSQTVYVATADDQLRTSLGSMLSTDGTRVLTFSDGYHLIEQLADPILHSEQLPNLRPSLIIADVVLAGCTGLSLVAGLRDLRWTTPIILLTRNHHDLKRARAWNGGVTSLFLAPFDVEELCAYATLLLVRSTANERDERRPQASAGMEHRPQASAVVARRSEMPRIARGTRDIPTPDWTRYSK